MFLHFLSLSRPRATRHTQPATRNPQRATRNPQLPTRNTQHATRNPQLPTLSLFLFLPLFLGAAQSIPTDQLLGLDHRHQPTGKNVFPTPSEADRRNAFLHRAERVVQSRLENIDPSDTEKGGYGEIAAALYRNHHIDWANRRLLQLLEEPRGDMFWMFPTTAIAYIGRDTLPEEGRRALRDAWRTYMPFRGDTENHWLMYYVTLYLMNQLYPDDPPESWFTGKSSAENRAEAEEYLLKWMHETTSIGQGEFDATHYIGVYLMPLGYLYTWAEDPLMRRRARILLEYIMADFAVELHHGLLAGSHSRTDERQVIRPWHGVSSDFAWLLFDETYPTPGYGWYSFWYCVSSRFQPPDIIYNIAVDRTEPFLHRETKRPRRFIRFTDNTAPPTYKTSYLHPDFALGSHQGGVAHGIQHHSWDLMWRVEDPREAYNTLFTLHPVADAHTLQMYFPEHKGGLVEGIASQKKSYNSPDKFIGGSVHEKIFQDRDSLIVLYQIPEGLRFSHINGFFSRDLDPLVEHPSGWIFARGGDALIAYYPLAPYRWEPLEKGGKRLVSDSLRNGAVLQVASADEFPSFEAFQEAILTLDLEVHTHPEPAVFFRSLRGRDLFFSYSNTPTIDGQPVDYDSWKLFEGPFLNAERGSGRLHLTYKNQSRILDLNSLTIQDSFSN